jgi:beta-galactosidase
VRGEAIVVDEEGVLVPAANNKLEFSIKGPGVIAAVDNGDVLSHEPFQAEFRSAYQGRCYVWIRAGASEGRITVTARSNNLKSDTIGFEIRR